MKSKSLSTVTCHVISAYGNTASNVIHACRAGGERVVGLVDARWNSALKQSRSQLATGVAKNADAVHQVLQKYTLQGLTLTSGGAQGVVNQIVKLADAGVMTVAHNVDRFEDKTGVNVLSSVAQVALPGALALSNLAQQIEQKSATLANRVAGERVVKVVAKRSRSVVRKTRPVVKAVARPVKKTAEKAAGAVVAA
ncbi:MAG: hypothetical protein AUJ20_05370 [Comamonadaceae bacterium CG1_02_60_18]|nr:MAG: hypothetical protein AUJ20_05370 [Comamonadaceae bacterium CG1_02_60_18]